MLEDLIQDAKKLPHLGGNGLTGEAECQWQDLFIELCRGQRGRSVNGTHVHTTRPLHPDWVFVLYICVTSGTIVKEHFWREQRLKGSVHPITKYTKIFYFLPTELHHITAQRGTTRPALTTGQHVFQPRIISLCSYRERKEENVFYLQWTVPLTQYTVACINVTSQACMKFQTL